MTIWQKIIVGALTGILWLAAIVAKHFFADIDIGLFVASCAGIIGALGIHGMATAGGGSAQGGFASMRLLAILVAIGVGLMMLGGCASITDAGHSSYTVRAVTDKNSKVQGYTLDMNDGKEFTEGRMVQFQTSAEGATLMLQEGPSKAFKGQAIGAKALSVFPVTDLANILSGGGK